ISLLVLMPVPYVNASAANLFPDRHARMIVSAAGILVEIFFTSVALFLWINLGDGLLRDIAFVVMTISGVSTVLFNANPLVKFDGYHFLADWLEIPDLAKRSGRYWSWLGKRYLLKVARLEPMDIAPGETKWLLLYAPASWFYRWLILAVIVTWMSDISLLLAIVVGIWFLMSLLVTPAFKISKYLWQSPDLSGKRLRSIATTGLLMLMLVIAVSVIPAPFSTITQGVVWAPDESRVRAAADGFVDDVLVVQNAMVTAGQPLIQLKNERLITHRQQLEAQLTAIDARLSASQQTDRNKAEQLRHESETVRAELERITEQTQALVIRSHTAGRVIIPRLADLPGRYIHQGDPLGYVLGQSETRLRAAIRQNDAKNLSQFQGSVSVKFNRPGNNILSASILQIQPAAGNQLPSPALGYPGGGIFLTDPADDKGQKTLTPIFLVDLRLPGQPVEHIGHRVWIRFDHGDKPLLQQWAIQWKQLLMQHFSSQA
ncbi:MAG TPA: biotin/lipoyl-binding protein, partial [Gammaproteobacteria bacterium]|nr:biotin/lipoyl-binding protein [Gammaproteobacteria bacterium]